VLWDNIVPELRLNQTLSFNMNLLIASVLSLLVIVVLVNPTQTADDRISSLEGAQHEIDLDHDSLFNTEDKRANVFRYGKRASVFRYGKRAPSVFRYGKRSPYTQEQEYEDMDNLLPKRIFRYGKRSGDLLAGIRGDGKRVFRYGKRGKLGEKIESEYVDDSTVFDNIDEVDVAKEVLVK